MNCEVCLSEKEVKTGSYILRTFDISLQEIEVRLRGLEFSHEEILGVVDLFFCL